MAVQLPTVTLDDLRNFHAKHFPTTPAPDHFFYGAEAETEEDYYDYEDDGLGYYEDGVKRTLTDEQIALFRHTEIQSIIRERRRKREAEDDSEPEPDGKRCVNHSPSIIMDLEPHRVQNAETPQEASNDPIVKTSTTPSTIPSPHNDRPLDRIQSGRIEKEYAGKKINSRQQQRNAKSRKKNRKNRTEKRKKRREGSVISGQTAEDEDSDEWSPRHQANGPDAQKDTTVDLDY